MKAISAFVTLMVFALAATFSASGARAETARIVIPKAALATAFNTALAAVEVHVDDYGAKHGTSWYDNRSYILMPNGKRHAIPVSEYEIAVTGKRHLKYYVNDFNSSSIVAHVDGANIKLVISFESQGEEVIGKCVHKPFKKWKECKLKMERDIHLNNARLTVMLRPIAYKGGISYAANPPVRFATDVRIASRLCQAFKGICGWIEGKIKKELTKGVQSSVQAGLNNSRGSIANAVKNAPAIRKLLGSGKVVRIGSRGSNFVVVVQR